MLIPEMTLTEFKLLKAHQIAEMKSIAVTANSDVLFYAIIPSKSGGMAIFDDISTHAEYLANRSNTVCGKTIEEIKGVPALPV